MRTIVIPETDDILLELPIEMRLKRIKETGISIARIIPEIATVISEDQSVGELCELMRPRKHIKLNEESLNQHIKWIDERANYASNPFILFDGRYSNGVSLVIQLGHYSTLESLTIRISSNLIQQHDATDRLISMISRIGKLFDACTGYVRQFQEVAFNNQHTMPMHTYDSSKIPCGICWINYWSQEQVNNVGREKVINAGWHKLIELPNKAIVTATTSERPDLVGNSEHLKRFEQISETLSLKSLQQQSEPSKYFQFDSW